MQMAEFLSSLRQVLDRETCTLQPDSRLEELGWSSLAIVSFIAFADEHFETPVSPALLARCETVSDLVALLGGRIQQPPQTAESGR
jgi:acyl carrier protein